MKRVRDIILKILKQVIITQILSIIFAIVGELYLRLLITYDWMFTDVKLLVLGFSLLTLLYIIIIKFFVKGNWLNVLLISIPYYLVYSPIILNEAPKLFPTYTDPNDFGVGIIGLVIFVCEFISVIIASVIGTYLNKRRDKIINIS